MLIRSGEKEGNSLPFRIFVVFFSLSLQGNVTKIERLDRSHFLHLPLGRQETFRRRQRNSRVACPLKQSAMNTALGNATRDFVARSKLKVAPTIWMPWGYINKLLIRGCFFSARTERKYGLLRKMGIAWVASLCPLFSPLATAT